MADFTSCANSQLTFEQLLSALITKTAGGDKALRVMLVDACTLDAVDCSNNSIDADSLLKASIGIASCGKPAIRLGIKPVDLASAFGAASYADLTAANTALSAGVIFYNIALAKLDITTA